MKKSFLRSKFDTMVAASFIVCCMAILPLTAAAYSGNDGPSWAKAGVNQACARKFIDCSLKRPGLTVEVERATFYQMLTKAFNVWDANATGPYSNLSGQWYEVAVNSAYNLGWVLGAPGKDYSFSSHSLMQRGDIAMVLQQVFQLPDGDLSTLDAFTDKADISSYQLHAVAAVVNAKLMGQGGTAFHPRQFLNKLEAIIIINNALNYAQQNSIDVTKPPYNSSRGG